MKKLKIGDRVDAGSCLGRGVVVESKPECKKIGLINVLFDETPPAQYNMENNPTYVFAHTLELIEQN